MKKLMLTLLLLLLSPLTINAEQHAFPAAGCLYYHKDQVNDQIGNGSGSLISPKHFLTAYHVIDLMLQNKDKYPTIWVKFDGHEPIEVKFLCGNAANDVAVMELLTPVYDIQPLEIAKENAKPGDTGSMSCAGHREVDIIMFEYEYFTDGTVYFNEYCWQGESGSSFLNIHGEVVGCLTGGFGLRYDKNGVVKRDCGNGWVTQSVRNSMSESTALEIRELLKNNGILEEVDKIDVISTSLIKDDKSIIEYYNPLVHNLLDVNTLYIVSAQWCGPCQKLKKMLPAWEKALKAAGIDKIVIVDGDIHKSMAQKIGVRAYPTLALYSKNKMLVRLQGVPTKEKLVEIIKKGLKK